MYQEISLRLSDGSEQNFPFLATGTTAYRFKQVFHRNSARVMDHDHRDRRDENRIACHCNDGRCRCSKTVYLDGDLSLVVTEHVVDLSCREAVASGAVYPDGDVAGSVLKIGTKKSRGDVIVKPRLFSDCSV